LKLKQSVVNGRETYLSADSALTQSCYAKDKGNDWKFEGKLTERLSIRLLLNVNPYPDISFGVDHAIFWFPQF
jgi:hypothetical protein